MVKSPKMSENEMEYRGSKSILFLIKIAFYLTIIFIFNFIYNYIYILEGANTVLLSAATQLKILPAVVYGNADLEKSSATIANKKKKQGFIDESTKLTLNVMLVVLLTCQIDFIIISI